MTPVGVRDGDPDALAGLCDRRGPAVLAYCEVVAGRGEIGAAAAADAFGSFRAGVVAAPDLDDLNPEALLISATRHASARYAGGDAPKDHARVPSLLAARADRSITLADLDWLEAHLETCWTCRAPVARFEAAGRAYRDPPATRLEPQVSAAILAALTAAAPVLGAVEEPPAIEAPSPNGSVVQHGPDAVARALPGAEGYVDQPTAAWQVGADGPEPAAPVPAPEEAPAPQPDRAARRTVKIGGLSRRLREPRAARGTAAPMPDVDPTAPEPRSGRGTELLRPLRESAEAGHRSRPAVRRGLVLPIVLVVLAIVVALLIAGVFGGEEPQSAPQSFAPDSGAQTDTTAAPVVVVPGAADASADAVERAKARTRAAKRRAAEARRDAAQEAATSATAGPTPVTVPPPAAPAGNGVAAPAPPPPPADDQAQIDAGDGATGAEELPPSEDTSKIPDLAPPAETADPPGQ